MVLLKRRIGIYEYPNMNDETQYLFTKDYVVGVFSTIVEAVKFVYNEYGMDEEDALDEAEDIMHDMALTGKNESPLFWENEKVNDVVDKSVKEHYKFEEWYWESEYVIEVF